MSFLNIHNILQMTYKFYTMIIPYHNVELSIYFIYFMIIELGSS